MIYLNPSTLLLSFCPRVEVEKLMSVFFSLESQQKAKGLQEMSTAAAGALLHLPLTTLLHALSRPVLNLILYVAKTCISAVSKKSLFYCTCPLSTLTRMFQACALYLKIRTKAAKWFKHGTVKALSITTQTMSSSATERLKESLTLLTLAGA